MKTKVQISLAVTAHAKLISAFVFRYTDCTISLLLKSEISSFLPASVTVQVGLCQTWLGTPKLAHVAAHMLVEVMKAA